MILASGDSAAAAELGSLLGTETVTTKTAETPAAARLIHPERVREMLVRGVGRAIASLREGQAQPWNVGDRVQIRMRFASTTHVDILMSIPGVSKVDGFTVQYDAENADQAYRLIRLMYRFIQT